MFSYSYFLLCNAECYNFFSSHYFDVRVRICHLAKLIFAGTGSIFTGNWRPGGRGGPWTKNVRTAQPTWVPAGSKYIWIPNRPWANPGPNLFGQPNVPPPLFSGVLPRGEDPLLVPLGDQVHLPGTPRPTRQPSQGKEAGWASAGVSLVIDSMRIR
jgi:hypothetical protein